MTSTKTAKPSKLLAGLLDGTITDLVADEPVQVPLSVVDGTTVVPLSAMVEALIARGYLVLPPLSLVTQ